MNSLIKNLVMLVTLVVWVAVIVAYLAQGQLPDAVLLGVPGAIYLALSPTLPGRRRSTSDGEPDDKPGEVLR